LPLAVVSWGKPFQCPSCRATLLTPRRRSLRAFVASVAATAGFGYVFNLDVLRFVVWMIIGFFPVCMVVSVIARYLAPPTLLVVDDAGADHPHGQGAIARTVAALQGVPPVECPNCAAKIGWERATFHTQFPCPACHRGLQLANSYPRVANVASIVVTGLVGYALGLRGDALFWTVCLGWFPLSVVLLNLTLCLFPPDAKMTGEFRGILYGEDEQQLGGDQRRPDGSNRSKG
jgi:hypothetical protein